MPALSGSYRPPPATILFDFDNAPLHSALPLDLTVDGLTAHFSATGQGFSVQTANDGGVFPQAPAGFSGLSLWPSSVFAADLLISFSRPLTDFSILYAVQDLNTDTSSTMQVRAYTGNALVGSSTMTAPQGNWPTATLAFGSATTFDNVVVHYLLPPPTGGDWGPIFAVDNMSVTSASSPPAVPVPGALPLFATGLGVMGMLGWRRKRTTAVIAH